MEHAFKPLRIGPVEIDFPLMLAALAGYSDLPYRLICRSCSAPYCASEAMLDRQMLVEGKLRRRLVKLDAGDHPVAGQIMGNDPAVMASAAAALDGLGFDVIDLNFACPVRKVVSKKRGGYLMGQPELALEIVRAVLESVPGRPVTIKLRRAFRETDRACDAFWKIARGSVEAGVAAVCVHARSVDQKYTGRADWDFLARVKREFPGRTVIGSGDVHTAYDALRMIEQTGVDGVLAARGAIGNPWIFRQARDIAAGRKPHQPDLAEQRELISRHFGLACQVYGPVRGLKIIRNFGLKYARMHPHPAKVRNACIQVKTERQWRELLDRFYSQPGV